MWSLLSFLLSSSARIVSERTRKRENSFFCFSCIFLCCVKTFSWLVFPLRLNIDQSKRRWLRSAKASSLETDSCPVDSTVDSDDEMTKEKGLQGCMAWSDRREKEKVTLLEFHSHSLRLSLLLIQLLAYFYLLLKKNTEKEQEKEEKRRTSWRQVQSSG